MGKGKTLREQRARERATRQSGELAPEPTRRPSPDDMGGGRLSSYARWEIGKDVYAWLILLPYLECAFHGPDSLPANLFAPQRAEENDEEYAARIKAHRLLMETQALADSPADQVAEVLSSWVPPSLVPGVVNSLSAEGLRHLNAAGPDPAEWQTGARPLLGVLCPAPHWDAALDQLEALAISRLTVTDYIAQRTTEQPVAAMHAAATLVAWLYRQPDIVADPAAARLELAERGDKFAQFVF